jgi:osmotically-inducible protein OsmY
VSSGFLRRTTVKLPLDQANLTDDGLAFAEVTSAQAFAREVPPVAAPARPLSAETEVSLPDTRLDGALLNADTRHAVALLLSRGGSAYKLALDQASFAGKELHVAGQLDALKPYYRDEDLTETVEETIARLHLNYDERRSVEVSVEAGDVLVRGNVRTKHSRQAVEAAVTSAEWVNAVTIDLPDDVSLEFDIAQALYRAGVAREAEVYPRSALGEVTLFGYATTPEAAAEAVRAASRVHGVRTVHDRLELRPKITAAA